MQTYRDLDWLGRIRLSPSFYLRDFLYSEIGAAFGIPNLPDDIDLAVHTGEQLCTRLLEPLQATFGRLHIRSGFRSARLNEFGNQHGLNCSSNARTFADHCWDRRDADGNAGATACIVVPWFVERYALEEWPRLAWWLFDSGLDFHRVVFFGKQAAFNIGWRDNPTREIMSHASPRGRLTGPGMLNGAGPHTDMYPGFPSLVQPVANPSAQPRGLSGCNSLQTPWGTVRASVSSGRTSACDGGVAT